MANEQRGEIEVEIAGKTYTMRPTFEALVEVEGAIGKSFIELLNSIQGARLKVTDAIPIIQLGIKGGGTKRENIPDSKAILEQIYKENPIRSKLLANAALFLIRVNNQFLEMSADAKEEGKTAGE